VTSSDDDLVDALRDQPLEVVLEHVGAQTFAACLRITASEGTVVNVGRPLAPSPSSTCPGSPPQTSPSEPSPTAWPTPTRSLRSSPGPRGHCSLTSPATGCYPSSTSSTTSPTPRGPRPAAERRRPGKDRHHRPRRARARPERPDASGEGLPDRCLRARPAPSARAARGFESGRLPHRRSVAALPRLGLASRVTRRWLRRKTHLMKRSGWGRSRGTHLVIFQETMIIRLVTGHLPDDPCAENVCHETDPRPPLNLSA